MNGYRSRIWKTVQDYVRFSFAASQNNITQAIENIKKVLY